MASLPATCPTPPGPTNPQPQIAATSLQTSEAPRAAHQSARAGSGVGVGGGRLSVEVAVGRRQRVTESGMGGHPSSAGTGRAGCPG